MKHAGEQGPSSHTRDQRTEGVDRKRQGPSRVSWTEWGFAERNHANHRESGADADLEIERQGRSIAWIPDDGFPDDEVSEGGEQVRAKAAEVRTVKAKPTKEQSAKATPADQRAVKAQSAALPIEKGIPTKGKSAKGKEAKKKSAKAKAAKENPTKGKSAKRKDVNRKTPKTEAEQAQRSGWETAPVTGRSFGSGRAGVDPFKNDAGFYDFGISRRVRTDPEKILPLADDPVGTGDSSPVSSTIPPLADDPVDVGGTGLESNPILPTSDDSVGSGTAVSGSAPLDSWRPDYAESKPASRPASEPMWTFKPESKPESVPTPKSGTPTASLPEPNPPDDAGLQDLPRTATKTSVQPVARSATAFLPATRRSTTTGSETETWAQEDEAGAGNESGNPVDEPEKTGDESRNGDGKQRSRRGAHRSKPKAFRFAFGTRAAASKAGEGDSEFPGGSGITSPRKVVGKSDVAAGSDRIADSNKIAGPGRIAGPDKTVQPGKSTEPDIIAQPDKTTKPDETGQSGWMGESDKTVEPGKTADSEERRKASPRETLGQAVDVVGGQSAFAFVYLAITIFLVVIGASAAVTYLHGKISGQMQSFLLDGGLNLLSCLLALIYVFFSARQTLTGHELHGDDQVRWITGHRILAWPLILALALLLVGQCLAYGLNLGLKALVPLLHISPAILLSPLTDLYTVPMQVYALLVLPLTEEIIFRGVIMNGLRRFGRVFAIITSAFLCAFMQVQPTQMIWAFLVGLVLGALAMEYGLVWSIVAHILANIGYSGLVVTWLSKDPVQVRGGAALVGGLIVLAGLVILVGRFPSLLAYARRYRAPKGVYASWRQFWFIVFCLCSLAVAVFQFA